MSEGHEGRAGLPGLPGEPGLPGLPGREGRQGEQGEQGEQGQQGAPAPKRSWWDQHRALVGYLALVFIAVASVGGFQAHANNSFDKRDQRSCIQRNRLATNQRVVLQTLDYMLGLELTEKNEHGVLERKRILRLQQSIRVRANGVNSGPENC